MYTPFVPLTLRIEYVLENLRDGFRFVGCDPGDMRYPHAYTTGQPLPGAACCLFPTLDGIHERWTWEIEVTVPRTIGDIDQTAAAPATSNGHGHGNANGINGGHSRAHEEPSMDEDRDLDMMVVCSADLVDEVFTPPTALSCRLTVERNTIPGTRQRKWSSLCSRNPSRPSTYP